MNNKTILYSFLVVALHNGTVPLQAQDVREQILTAPNAPAIKVRMEGPYAADVPLQVVCYFKHKPTGDTTKGAAVDLDNKLKGAIAALRDNGGFTGDEQETLLLTCPEGTIKPKQLLLIGLGDEAALRLDVMERVGRTAYRHAAALGVKQVALAPLLRDQGNDTLSVGDAKPPSSVACSTPTIPSANSTPGASPPLPPSNPGKSRPAPPFPTKPSRASSPPSKSPPTPEPRPVQTYSRTLRDVSRTWNDSPNRRSQDKQSCTA